MKWSFFFFCFFPFLKLLGFWGDSSLSGWCCLGPPCPKFLSVGATEAPFKTDIHVPQFPFSSPSLLQWRCFEGLQREAVSAACTTDTFSPFYNPPTRRSSDRNPFRYPNTRPASTGPTTSPETCAAMLPLLSKPESPVRIHFFPQERALAATAPAKIFQPLAPPKEPTANPSSEDGMKDLIVHRRVTRFGEVPGKHPLRTTVLFFVCPQFRLSPRVFLNGRSPQRDSPPSLTVLPFKRPQPRLPS